MTDYLDGQHYDRVTMIDPMFHGSLTVHDGIGKEIIKICPDGRIFWNSREIETDDEFKSCMIELKDVLLRGN